MPSPYLGLVLHRLRGCFDFLRIPQVASGCQRCHRRFIWNRLQVCIELVDEWRSGGNLETRDDLVGNVLQILHDGTDGIAVSSDKHCLPCLQLWNNYTFPERHYPVDDGRQTLRCGNLCITKSLVLGLLPRMVLTVRLNLGWRKIEAAAPDLDLLSTMFHDCLFLVQACEPSIHAFIQSPAL